MARLYGVSRARVTRALGWPFELGLAGVTTREEMLRTDRDEDGDGDDDEEPRLERGTPKSDVFLVAGEQLRFGSKSGWSVATR